MQRKNRSFFCNNDCLRISFYNKENRKHQKLRFDPTGAVFFRQRHIYIKNPVEKIEEFRNKDSLLDVVSPFYHQYHRRYRKDKMEFLKYKKDYFGWVRSNTLAVPSPPFHFFLLFRQLFPPFNGFDLWRRQKLHENYNIRIFGVKQ